MRKRVGILRTAMVAALVASVVFACPAAAQDGAKKAAADALFAEGRALVTQGKYAEACEKFAESERFEAAVGTSLNLGECHERLGRTASAYGAFGEAKRLAALRGDTEREAHAKERREALEPRLSKIALSVPSKARGVKVLLDGRELGAGAIGAAIPVDPGRHVVNAVAPDKPMPFDKEVIVGPGPVTVAVEIVFPGEKPPSDGSSWNMMRSTGVVVGAAGIVGVLVGGGFGIGAIVKNDASKAECLPADPTKCSLRGLSLNRQAGTYANVSTGAFVAGGALVGVGVMLYLMGGMEGVKKKPKAEEIQIIPVVAPGFGGAMAGVEF